MTYNFDMMIPKSRNLIVRLSNELYGVGHLLLAGRSLLPCAVPLSSCLRTVASAPIPSQVNQAVRKSCIKQGDRHFDAENHILNSTSIW
jgi:hypothetical protein